MTLQPWFERRWDFVNIPDTYESTLTRLSAAIPALRDLTGDIPQDALRLRPGGKWSVKEHIGHLIVLEPLWRVRFEDILENRQEMTVADTRNMATWEGSFNDRDLGDLLAQFSGERMSTIRLLESMGTPDHSKSSRHPRLGQPFRIVDHAFFIAEHDSHHIERIREIKATSN